MTALVVEFPDRSPLFPVTFPAQFQTMMDVMVWMSFGLGTAVTVSIALVVLIRERRKAAQLPPDAPPPRRIWPLPTIIGSVILVTNFGFMLAFQHIIHVLFAQ